MVGYAKITEKFEILLLILINNLKIIVQRIFYHRKEKEQICQDHGKVLSKNNIIYIKTKINFLSLTYSICNSLMVTL